MDDACSFLTPAGYQRGSCGYCRSKDKRSRQASSASVGAESSTLRPSQYQTLVDRGWRRSGTYYYKPDNRHTCCPHYTIRLDAPAFDSRKDQRKAINRWNHYILGTEYVQNVARFCPKTRQEKKHQRNTFDLQISVHASEYQNIKRPIDTRSKKPIEPAHNFEVTLEPDTFTEEKYALFENYQRVVHHEKPSSISRHGFKNFLCSGLGQETIPTDTQEKNVGSYHQCYRLDGQLVAMAVLDLLPDCVSSVYLMYHEDVNEWNFGKLSGMREIALAVEDGYRYYYMGYYIHSCIKMRYKGFFRPTYVLDPISHAWDPLDTYMLRRLSTQSFVSMTIERMLDLPTHSDLPSLVSHPSSQSNSRFHNEIHIGNVKYRKAIEYINGPEQEENSHPDKLERTNVFEAGTPGAMSLDEVAREIDLGLWRLDMQDRTVRLEDLVAWEDSEISDAHTIKGIAAELASCIGPELVKETILRFPF